LVDSDYLALAFLCFRIGIEYLTLELSLSHSVFSKILERKPKTTRIILSHCFGSDVTSWTHPAVRSAYAQAVHAGADLVRLELNANSAAAALSASSLHEEILRAGTPPCISVVVGPHAQLTPIINTIFTPVAHSILACAIGWEGPSFDHAVNSLYHTALEAACRIFAIPYASPDVDRGRSHEKSEGPQQKEQISKRIRIIQHGLQLLHMPHVIQTTGTVNDALSSIIASVRSKGGAVHSTSTLSPELLSLNHQDNPVRRSTLVNMSGQFDLVTAYPTALHNVQCCAIAKVALKSLSPINAVTCLSSALLIGPPSEVCRNAFAALVAMGFMQIYLSGSDSSQMSLSSGQNRWGTATPPKVSALSENLGTLQPTVVMVAGNLSLEDVMPSKNPFGCYTGGTVINLLEGEDYATSSTAIRDAIASSSNPEGWVTCGYAEVEREATATAFRLLIGFACPDRAFSGIGQAS
jgi:pentafunctional AROM polypeptide